MSVAKSEEKSEPPAAVDALSERLASFGCQRARYDDRRRITTAGRRPRKPPPPLLKAVYVGGPSGVGKTAALIHIRALYRWARVSNVNFRNLFELYDGDAEEAAHHLVTYRNAPMIYEHTDECTVLHRIVRDYMRRSEEGMTREDLHSCHRDCANALAKPSSSTLVIVLDTTESYARRYEKLQDSTYTDFHDKRYLYFQTAAYLAFLSKRNLYPFMRVVIAADDWNGGGRTPRMFGGADDYGLASLLRGLIDTDNDIVTDRLDLDTVASVVADCHVSRADESLELS